MRDSCESCIIVPAISRDPPSHEGDRSEQENSTGGLCLWLRRRPDPSCNLIYDDTFQTILYSYWRSSCSWRVRIALNLKEVVYETKGVNIEKPDGELSTKEFSQINPMARVPVLRIDDRTLTESLNIMHYLEETRPEPALMPRDMDRRVKVREICEIIATGIQPVQNIGILRHLDKEKRFPWAQRWIIKGFVALEQILETSASKYCVGDEITLADCCLVPQVYNARKFRVDLKPYPNISRIDRELEIHPAFVAAHADKQPDVPREVPQI